MKIKYLEEELENQREMNKKILKQMRQMEYALLEHKKLRAKEKLSKGGSKNLTNGEASSVPSGGNKTTSNSLK